MNIDLARLAALLSIALLEPAIAAEPPAQPVLVISGKSLSAPAGISLRMAELQALPQHSFTTRTPWTKTEQRFSGPLLRDVLQRAQARGTQIVATALNDYQVSIPVADAQDFDVIIATHIDGNPIPVRERGPLFVIYPFDSKPQLQAQRFYERSIWQLKSMRVE